MIAITDYDTGNLRSVANALRRTGAEFTVTSDAAVLRRADKVILPGVGEASSAMAKLRERGLDALIPTLTQPVLGICIGMQLMCLDSEEGGTRCLGIFPAHVVRLGGKAITAGLPGAGQAAATGYGADTPAAAGCTEIPGTWMAATEAGAPISGTGNPTATGRADTPADARGVSLETGAATPVSGIFRKTGTAPAGESPLKIPHVGWDTIGGLRGPLFDGLGDETYVYYVHSYAAQLCGAAIATTDYGGAFSAALGCGNFFGTQFHPEKSGTAGERILRNFLNL